jgi:MFS family permease
VAERPTHQPRRRDRNVLLLANIPVLAVVLPLIAVSGLFIVGFFVITQTLLQLHIADEYRGRVVGALGPTTALMGLIGLLIASALGDHVGAVGWLDSSGCLNVLAGVVAIVLLRRAMLPTGQTDADREPAHAMVAMREPGELGDPGAVGVSLARASAFKKA